MQYQKTVTKDLLLTGSLGKVFLSQISVRGLPIDGTYVHLRDLDAIAELARGSIDLAFVGSDVLGELPIEDVTIEAEFVPPREHKPRLVLMGDKNFGLPYFESAVKNGSNACVATSNPQLLAAFADDIGLGLGDVMVVAGSVESYPPRGLVDLAFDIVETGATMEAAGLVPIKEGEPLSLVALSGIRLAPATLEEKIKMIDARVLSRLHDPTGSVTSGVIRSDNTAVKRLGEEFAELVDAFARSDPDEFVAEAADMLQRMRVAATRRGRTLLDILNADTERGMK